MMHEAGWIAVFSVLGLIQTVISAISARKDTAFQIIYKTKVTVVSDFYISTHANQNTNFRSSSLRVHFCTEYIEVLELSFWVFMYLYIGLHFKLVYYTSFVERRNQQWRLVRCPSPCRCALSKQISSIRLRNPNPRSIYGADSSLPCPQEPATGPKN